MTELESRLRGAWQGRVSGCMLGKAVEAFSMSSGYDALGDYLRANHAWPLRDYVPLAEEPPPLLLTRCCRGGFDASVPDDDVNYSVLALRMLERFGREFTTEAVARTWLNELPVGMTFTAERAAYRTLLEEGHEYFSLGAPAGFDLARRAENPYNDWIGAQIRADVYGWVARGDPELAARLARADAELSHRGDGVLGAVVASGWDTDCNGATVGALWALEGEPVPERWTAPWRGRVAVSLAGQGELALEELVERTKRVAETLAA